MAKLIYTAIASLDGYVEDADGGFVWAAPDDEVLAYVNDLERPVGTYLYGRRMYQTMAIWESVTDDEQAAVTSDFARIWRAAEKIVYSRSLAEPATSRTRIVGEFDPFEVRRLKESATADLSIGGAQLAGQALAAGLVDELRLFLGPVIVGGGKPALPGGVHTRLELLGERPFRGGVTYLRYRVNYTPEADR
ncbi:dihydrofolate reductase family protein [Actinospica durhamensis]|uniref:Dihydrofolate reductase family protein n=1 Tax=Actinospica durhamensis TaxID=1508375 RepID=A0A941ELP8_9ACTN|nr:dihydrofolate reductase family protein [Actinospica durhamensis]MBR7834725.1 dihydrofolate reductase family protein [Actinospica durhamensis]